MNRPSTSQDWIIWFELQPQYTKAFAGKLLHIMVDYGGFTYHDAADFVFDVISEAEEMGLQHQKRKE